MNEFKQYNELFKNSWKSSISEEQLQEILTTISPETWNLIKKHRNEYCNHIQTLIQTQMEFEMFGTTKMKVVEVDDELWNKMLRERRNAHEKEYAARWLEYKQKHNLIRPKSILDDEKIKVMQDIETLKASLSKLQGAQAKKYVAPSSRRTEPVKNKAETDLISKIGFLENELKNIGDRIVKEDNDWDYCARREFEHKRFLESNKAYYGM